jgi:REP element-mobilizing transposase RayT
VVVGYVVMPEHIHLLITEPEIGTPSKVIQVVKQPSRRKEQSDDRSYAKGVRAPELSTAECA